jgi:photosystem II stability/assembly factor-like uncharacterized protein
MKDGSILITSYGYLHSRHGWGEGHEMAAMYRSKNEGRTWKFFSSVHTDHDLEEAHTAELPDGRLVMIARPNGDIAWSSDSGQSWTPPVSFGIRTFAPTLTVLADGTLLCLYMGNPVGGLYATFSADGGKTWIAPSLHQGFLVDHVYGYSQDVLLPDGSVYLVYQNNMSLNAEQIKDQALFALRLRVRADHSGIDLLAPVAD